jgi:flagellar basal-body rod protein FlgC
MVSPINISLSGLEAAGRRIENSAANLANKFSTSTQVNGVTTSDPYLPQDIVQISEAGGGVRAYQRTVSNPTIVQYDPQSEAADEGGFVKLPNVDDAKQLVDQQIATYDFKANLKAIKVAANLEQSLLDIVS